MYSYWSVGANLGTRLKVGKLIHVFPHICLVSGKLVTKTHRKPLPEFTVQLPHSWWCESRVISAPRWGTDSDSSGRRGSLLGEHLDISCELKTLSDKETCRKSGELCSLQILGLFECNRQRQPPMEHTSAPLRPGEKLLANNSSTASSYWVAEMMDGLLTTYWALWWKLAMN